MQCEQEVRAFIVKRPKGLLLVVGGVSDQSVTEHEEYLGFCLTSRFMSSRKERLIYVGISVENIIAPSVRDRHRTFFPQITMYLLMFVTGSLFTHRWWRRKRSLRSSKRRRK